MSGQLPPQMMGKSQLNPVAEGMDGIKTMRAASECNLKEETEKLNRQLQPLLLKGIDNEDVDAALGKGLVTGLKMNTHCRTHLKKRTVVTFEDDDELRNLTQEIKKSEKRALELQKQLQDEVNKVGPLLEERWNYSVKHYGLDPEKNFYCILDDDGIIEEVELQCHHCKAGETIAAATETLKKHNNPKEESNDARGTEGSAGDGGEARSQE